MGLYPTPAELRLSKVDAKQGRTNFWNDLSKGQKGEKMFADFVKQCGCFCIHTDLICPFDYYLFDNSCEKWYKVDVKANYKSDGQLVFEQWSDVGKKRGWVHDQSVDVWVFINPDSGDMVWVNAPAVRDRWLIIREEHPMILNSINSRNAYQSAFISIPIGSLIQIIGADNVSIMNMN